jgi:hypothetical protein
MQLWDRSDEDCRWPSWQECGPDVVSTLQVPLGHERLLGAVEPEHAPLALARRLEQTPEDVLELSGPFAMASMDRRTESMTLLTDSLGLGRLFELDTAEGRFWSNRPVAALLFAGVRAQADPLAWRRMAACDWPMGNETPYQGVRAVPAATQIRIDKTGHRERSLDVLSLLAHRRREPLTDSSVERTATALKETARSISKLWPQVPTLSLSGGRDSRLVVAAFVAAAAEVRLKTYPEPGEVQAARQLVALLPRPVPHTVREQSAAEPTQTAGPSSGAYLRALRWHDLTEGLRPAVYLKNRPPSALLRQRPALICGVRGEFGHAPGYPGDAARLERLPRARRLNAFADSLQAKIVLPRGLAEHSVAAVRDQIRRVLEHADLRGVTDSKALDWFYADERLRRWGLVGESYGRVLPLLVPEFLSAAFGLSTAESVDSALHRALITRLVPAWSDVAFYSASLRQRQAVQRVRLWQEDDVELLSRVIADPTDWGDAFDVEQVQSIWSAARAGRAAARDELLLQRVVWRAAFSDHLAALNGEAPRRRPHVEPSTPSPTGRGAGRPLGWLAERANDVALARRLARTALGRRVRRRLGV